MPKDTYDKIKIISDVVSDNKLLAAVLVASLGSMMTNANQYFIGQEDDFTKRVLVDQLDIAYAVKKDDCGETLMNKHKREDH